MQEEYEHAAPQNDESAFETILFRILLLTDEICTYVCVYLIFDVREQLVDDDGIKRYQGTQIIMSLCKCLLFCTWFHDDKVENCVYTIFRTLFLQKIFISIAFLRLSKLVLIS